jgi:hypothetical protein
MKNDFLALFESFIDFFQSIIVKFRNKILLKILKNFLYEIEIMFFTL